MNDSTKPHAWRRFASKVRRFLRERSDAENHFEPHTLAFWRNMLIYLFAFSMAGHAMEIPYCALMGSLFGIVDDDYAAMVDPWYVPYWVYGIGAVGMILIMVPAKARLLRTCSTRRGAVLAFFVLAVAMCAFLETAMGLIVNQPDHLGEYPYWNNSELPLNILGQGWLVNDILLGAVATAFVWLVFPLCQKAMLAIGRRLSNHVFKASMATCSACCIMTYAIPTLA